MLSFIVRRTFVAVIVLFLLSLAMFTMLRIMPGDDVICPGFCSHAEREDRRIEYGLDKPWFPLSVNFDGTSVWWLLALPAAAAGGYAIVRNARRLRGSAIADYALPRLAWNLAIVSVLVGALLVAFEWESREAMLRVLIFGTPEAAEAFRKLEARVAEMGAFVHPAVPITNRLADDGAWLLALPVATLLAFALASLLTRPRIVTIPRAD